MSTGYAAFVSCPFSISPLYKIQREAGDLTEQPLNNKHLLVAKHLKNPP